MKRVLFTSLCLGLLITSCKKTDDLAPAASDSGEQAGISIPVTPPAPGRDGATSVQTRTVMITNWETPSDWMRQAEDNSMISYTSNRAFQQMTSSMVSDGVVLAFARGYNFADSSTRTPMGMPFQFYLPFERMDHPIEWMYTPQLSRVAVTLRMKNDAASVFQAGQEGIGVRYFLISSEEMQQRGWNPRDVRVMSYQQLRTAYGLSQ